MSDEENDEESAHDGEDTVLRGSVLSRYISRFRYGEPQSRTQRCSQKSRGKEFWWLDSDSEVASPRQADSSSDDNFGLIVGLAQESSVPQYQKQQKLDRLNQKTLLNQSKKRLYAKPPKYISTNNSAIVRSYSGRDSPEQDQFQSEQSETPERPFHEHNNKAINGEDLLVEWRKKKRNGLKDNSDNNKILSTGMGLDNERPASPTPSAELSHDSSCDPVISSEGIGSSTAGGSSAEDVSFKPNFIHFLNSTKKDSDIDKYNCGLPFSQYWKDNLDNDLLYQWRVKRRIQLAREQAQYKQGYQVSHTSNQAQLHGIGTLYPGAGKVNLVEEPLETHEQDTSWSIQNCSGNLHTSFGQNPATVVTQTEEEVKRQLPDANLQSKVNVEVQTYPDLNLPKVTTTQTIPIASPQLKQCNSCSKSVPAHVHMECDILPCQHCSHKNTSSTVALDPDKPVTLEPTEYRKYLVAEKPHHCMKPAVNPGVDQKQRQDSGKEKKTSRTDKKNGKCNRRPPHGPSALWNGTPRGPSVGTSSGSGEVLTTALHRSSEFLTTTPHASGVGLTDTPQLIKTSESKLYKMTSNKEKDYLIEDENNGSTNKSIPNLSLTPQQSSLEPQIMLEIKDHSRAVPLVPAPGSIPSEAVRAPVPDLFDDMYNSDETDFPSDPLLQYLRKLRSHYQAKIRDVDRKLKNLHPQEMVQLEDPCSRNI